MKIDNFLLEVPGLRPTIFPSGYKFVPNEIGMDISSCRTFCDLVSEGVWKVHSLKRLYWASNHMFKDSMYLIADNDGVMESFFFSGWMTQLTRNAQWKLEWPGTYRDLSVSAYQLLRFTVEASKPSLQVCFSNPGPQLSKFT